jgi:acyl-CoA thioesterase
MAEEKNISEIVSVMREKDSFLRWPNPSEFDVKEGYCRIVIPVRDDFLNHVGSVHGGITFSLADAAFAYASNSHNRIAIALDVSIAFPSAANAGDVLTAVAQEDFLGGKTAIYRVTVTNQNNELIAIFNGTVYRKKQTHINS